jgi:predicted Zn finger-like uncharacterized protein
MILVCPSCDTRYFADDTSIGKEGRRVRCATCGHAWHAKLPEEEGEPAAAAEDTGLTREQVERLRQTAQANSKARAGPHAEFRAREHAKRKRNRGRAVGIAWGIGAGVFAVALAGAILFRNEVSEAFPKAASIYRLVGLEVNRFGLALENVNAKRSFDGTTPVLTVTGSVVNTSDERVDTPQLRVTLKDESGKEVQTWTDSFKVPSLGPQERSEFASRFEAPPVETYRLTVSFARKDGEGAGGETNIEATKDGGKPKAPEHAAPAAAPVSGGAGAGAEPGWSGGDGDDDHASAAEDHAPAPVSAKTPAENANH